MNKTFELLPLNECHLKMVLDWRNEPAVRKNMYTSHEISFPEHKSWFDSLAGNKTKAYFIAVIDGVESGVLGFSNINSVKGIATWAFFTSPTAKRGSGSLMEFYALDYAFNKLSLHKLKCEVLSFNQAVVKMHCKFGFIVEGQHRDAFFDGSKYHDIVHLGVFSSEWSEMRPLMQKKLRIE